MERLEGEEGGWNDWRESREDRDKSDEGGQEYNGMIVQDNIFIPLHPLPSHPYINGCLLCEGSDRVYMVVQDDDAHHYSETEESCILILKPR